MNLCFIDFETTGSDLFIDQPIQLGAILVDKNLKVIKSFQSEMFLPKKVKISEIAFSIHGLSYENLKLSPKRKKVIESFFDTLGTDYCFAGWNTSFDVPFMKKLCFESKLMDKFKKVDYHHIDVQSIATYLRIIQKLPSNLITLNDIISYFGLSRLNKHNALEDAELTFQVYKNLLLL